MIILKIFAEYLAATLIFIIFLILVVFLLFKKFFSSGSKTNVPLKKAKKVIFKIGDIVEDYETATIKKSNEIPYYEVIEALKNLVENKNIEEVVIDVDNVELSDIHIAELEPIFEKLNENKKVTAIATDLDTKSYKIALFAKEIFMLKSRQSNLTFRGYSFQDFYIGKLLAKLGIKVNVLHIGDYKVAGENFHLDSMTKERSSSLQTIGDETLDNFINLIKNKRNIDINQKIMNGDLIFIENEQAKDFGLIDGTFTYNEFEEKYDMDKDTISFLEYMQQYKVKKNKIKDKIAVIYLEGVIQEDSRDSQNYISYEKVKEKVEIVKEIENLKAVILRIDSPGGSAIESEKIYQKLKTLSVPIYVSMGNYCASGGYYLASVGERLFANAETLTGSIGVVLIYPELSEILEKNQVNIENVSKGEGFDIFNIFSKLSETSKEKIISTMRNTYEEFKEHVISARKMTDEELEKLAGGRVWLGSQAKENGLVDEIGTLDDCIKSLASRLELKEYKLEHIQLRKSFKEMAVNFIPKISGFSFIDNKRIDEINFVLKNSNSILFYENIKKDFL